MDVNELVQFLAGNWENTAIEVDRSQPIQRQVFRETVHRKGLDTLRVSTVGDSDQSHPLDLLQNMQLIVRGKEVKLRQGSFMAQGSRKGNMVVAQGRKETQEIVYRMYVMETKFVIHREIWEDGEVVQVDTNYLERLTGNA